MMKKMIEIVMVAVIIAGVAGAYFKWMGALPIAVTQTQKISTFDVSGEGKVVVIPDQAVVSLGVQETGSNLKQVQEAVNKKMASVAKSLKEMGIAEKDIKTTGYNFYPDWQVKNKYSAHASIEVVVREMDKVSPVMDLVSSLGLDNVQGPTFGLSDELMNKTIKEARGLAIDKAKAKAEELAQLAGMKLGRIVNITEGQNRPQNYLVREALPMTGGGAVDAKTATPVEVGSSEVLVDVTLSYETR
ncbi:MAG: SIMPL domain-containing protein [Microgenomates group bacterium]